MRTQKESIKHAKELTARVDATVKAAKEAHIAKASQVSPEEARAIQLAKDAYKVFVEKANKCGADSTEAKLAKNAYAEACAARDAFDADAPQIQPVTEAALKSFKQDVANFVIKRTLQIYQNQSGMTDFDPDVISDALLGSLDDLSEELDIAMENID